MKSSGNPVSGATVDLYAPTGKYGGTTLTTGDSGTVSYWVANGTYRVCVSKNSVTVCSDFFTVPGTTEVTVDPPDGQSFELITVPIDIKPGTNPNHINLGSNGVVPVAILTSDTFNATQVSPDTISLAGAGVAMRGRSSKYLAHEEDVNGDGLLDLVIQVVTENLDPGTFQDGFAILTGSTLGENPIPIQGEDEIVIVPPE